MNNSVYLSNAFSQYEIYRLRQKRLNMNLCIHIYIFIKLQLIKTEQ